MKIPTHILTFPILAFLFACSADSPWATANTMIKSRNAFPDQPVTEIIDSLKIDKDLLTIYVSKSHYTLQLMYDTVVIKTYPIVLGGNPVDDKRREGDLCTPEGRFELRAIYPHNKWSKFLWIDYPTVESWKKFNDAKTAGDIPEIASIGGEIGIHGVPDGNDGLIDEGTNWTLGCISLKNKDIDEIYDVVHVGTKVLIAK